MPTYSLLDKLIMHVDLSLQTLLTPKHRASSRPNPANTVEESQLSLKEKKHIAGLMRVNHSGEVAAQALYQGQALTAKLNTVRDKMEQAAIEEIDHLSWCETRLTELQAAPSIINPAWYALSFSIGAIAGLIGDGWSLGFVAETEQQVTAHLKGHLKQLPKNDKKTQAILAQMVIDESLHASHAIDAGGKELPFFIKMLMQFMSKVMTKSSYYF